MAGTTPGGLPYPTGSDLVVQGDNAIRALAEGTDGKFANPLFQSFTAVRNAVPTGNTNYSITLTPLRASVPPMPYTYDGADQSLLLPAGLYLYTATIYIDWANGGTGGLVQLRNPANAGGAGYVASNPFGGTQVVTVSTLLQHTAPTKYILDGNHNSGGARNLLGTVVVRKFALI